MDIAPVDAVVMIVDHATHEERDQRQRRQQQRRRDRTPGGPVYTAHGTVEEAPPPKIDVLV